MNDHDPGEMMDLVVDALERSRQRGVLLTGAALDGHRLTNDVLPIDSAPHDWLFPRVAAVVHHGGAGTTGEGLRAGRPTVIVPFIADQHFWGQQVYERGVGPRPLSRRHLSAETLARAIEAAVTDTGIVARARAMGERVRAEDGIGAAVEAVHTAFTSRSQGVAMSLEVHGA